MFSGIVQEVGIIQSLEFKNGLLELIVFSNKLTDIQIGDSIAVDGCCLTAIETMQSPISNSQLLFKVQVTEETLEKTNLGNLKNGSKVNLEPSLRLGDKICGHLVSGHVDTCGEILSIECEKCNDNMIVKIKYPFELRTFLASKGSITVNGVSLTVIESKDNIFSFTLIPFTRDNTNLGLIKVSDHVNLEIDLVSRYLVNYLEREKLETRG